VITKAIYRLCLLALVSLGFLFFVLDLMIGSVYIPFSDLLDVLIGVDVGHASWEYIVLNYRLPKAVTAVLVGLSLSVSGLLMQTLFRNPLAGPSVLGISNGAGMGVAVLMMSSVLGTWASTSVWGLVLASVLGSLLVLALVLLISFRMKNIYSLLIIGIMIGSVSGAMISVLQYFSNAKDIQSYVLWTFGSLSGMTWTSLQILIPIVLFGLLAIIPLLKGLNAMLLGETYAEGLGINIKRYRVLVILITCLLVGSITSFCGPIAFVGLAVPHIARALYRSANHYALFPLSILIGLNLMLICDIIAQLPWSSKVLPINAVTALIGAPIVILVVFKSSKTVQV